MNSDKVFGTYNHVAGLSGASMLPVVPWFVAAFAAASRHQQRGLAHLKDFATVGFKPILLMVSETVFLAILVIGFIVFAR